MRPFCDDGFVFAARRRERLGDSRFARFLRLGSEIARLSDVHAHAFDTDQRPSRSLSVRGYPGGDLLLVASHFLLDDQDYGDRRRLIGIVGFSLPGASNVPGYRDLLRAVRSELGLLFRDPSANTRRGKEDEGKSSRSRQQQMRKIFHDRNLVRAASVVNLCFPQI